MLVALANGTMTRRTFLHLAAAAAALPALPRIVRAQAYPTRPVRIIAAFAAGGGVDITAYAMVMQNINRELCRRLRRADNRIAELTDAARESMTQIRVRPMG